MRKISVPQDHIETLFGSYDENLRQLESTFDVLIRTQGHDLLVEGDPANEEKVARTVTQLGALLREGYRVTSGEVKTAAQLIAQDGDVELRDFLVRGAVVSAGKRQVAPKSVNQRRYLEAIDKHDIVFGIGPAGTGKTYLAMAAAVDSLINGSVRRIILTRPAVEAGERLGFLPGDLTAKVDPYLRPLYDALWDMLGPEETASLIDRGTIEIAPLAYMRGRTLNDACVILDEAQNTTPEQMKMFLTRLGFNSKMIITGDISQTDLPTGKHSGLRVVRDILRDIPGVSFVELGSRDVVRHRIVASIVEAYQRFESSES
jgi:phosphate starvation-inducible PhoH-like protein